jgi:hypothetical protein
VKLVVQQHHAWNHAGGIQSEMALAGPKSPKPSGKRKQSGFSRDWNRIAFPIIKEDTEHLALKYVDKVNEKNFILSANDVEAKESKIN